MSSFKNQATFYDYFNWLYRGLAVASLGFFVLLIGNSGLLSGNTKVDNIFWIAILFLISSTLLATAAGIVKHSQGVENSEELKYSNIHEFIGIFGAFIFTYATASLILGIAKENNVNISPIIIDAFYEIAQPLPLTIIIIAIPLIIFVFHAYKMDKIQKEGKKEKVGGLEAKRTEQTEN